MTAASIASLHVYPIKGARGLTPASAVLTPTGLSTHGARDREWMVVAPDGRFVTQREAPQLALVEVTAADGVLTLQVPGVPAVAVVLAAAGPSMEVEVWRHRGRGLDAGDGAAALLSTWLATPVRLVRFDPATPRACNAEFTQGHDAHTLYSDGYPLLVISTASLLELNRRLTTRGGGALPMNRFRPNLVLDGLPAYEEDHLHSIEIGDVTLLCVKPCVRCTVTTTDQATGETGSEPLRTLGEYRMNEKMGGVTFGMNAIVTRGAGTTLAAGDAAVVHHRF